MFSQQVHRYLFWLGTATMAISLPLSPFLLSVGLFILVGNWIIDLKLKEKFEAFKKHPSIFFFLVIFLVHIFWLLNTTNWHYALHDIKIKLPLLALPIIFGTSQPLDKKEFKLLQYVFIGAVFIASIVSTYIYLGFGNSKPIDNRNASIIISHIRFALMLVLSIYMCISIISKNNNAIKIIYSFIILWFIFYIFFIGAFTGFVIFIITFPFLIYYWAIIKAKAQIRKILLWSVASFLFFIILYLGYTIKRYTTRDEVNTKTLPTYTANGGVYLHDTISPYYENKNKVWLYVCDGELNRNWNAVSSYDYDGVTQKGQSVRHTVIRYLTSLGYTKDSLGISKLTPEDIRMIEHGYSNYLFKYKWSLYPRLYTIYWEIENYIITKNPSGHSLLQRLAMFKNGVACFKRFPLLGTGTGDINDEIVKQYNLSNSVLEAHWRFRPHNQYLTFLASFGLIGFLLIVVFFIKTLKQEKANIDFISLAFLLIVLLSMLTEDTLETQAGVNFFAFFFSIFFLGRDLNPQNK